MTTQMQPGGAYGAVEGVAQTMPGGLAFSLRIEGGGVVPCSVLADRGDLVRGIGGRRVRVYGVLSHDPATGGPRAVHEVYRIDVLKEWGLGDYRVARGVAPAVPDAPLPEERIRRLRDAWE